MVEQADRIEFVARIVTAYVSGNAVAATALEGLLRDVDRALAGLARRPDTTVRKPTHDQYSGGVEFLNANDPTSDTGNKTASADPVGDNAH